MPQVPAFHKTTYERLVTVPQGKVTTYGDLAQAMGRPGAARAVGTAMARNPNPGPVPCHRVVRSDGYVGNYQGGPGGQAKKIRMLRDEGVDIGPDGYVKDFPSHRHRFD